MSTHRRDQFRTRAATRGLRAWRHTDQPLRHDTWRWFFEGCDVLRDTEAILARTGWTHLEVQRYHVPTLFLPINTQIAGTALRTNPAERT
jgi:hypothetical protein